jgi:hypothetical protein
MSNGEQPTGQDGRGVGPTPPPSARSGCLTAFLILAGIVLLLPGLCAVVLIVFDWKSALSGSTLSVVVTFLAIAAGGIIMIREGIRGPRR